MRCRRVVAAVLIVLTVTACAGDDANGLTVLAGASLTDAFTDMAAAYEETEPGVKIEVGFAGSSTLAAQIIAGAPADVFAAADERTMARLVDAGAVLGVPVSFATNRLTIVVPAGNPAEIAGLPDLLRPGVLVALCAVEVPCGSLAAGAFTAAGLMVPAASREGDVRSVLTRVELGEADAGLVYVTDAAAAAGRVEEIPLSGDAATVTAYPIAALASAADPVAAAAFIEFVSSDRGRAILTAHGFGTP